MPHAGFKHQPPGKDVKDFMQFNDLFATRPKLAKFIMQQMFFKGQYDAAVMTDAQLQEAEEAEAKLAAMGDEFEIIGESK